jgi:HK97 family phage major capsid protein
MDIAALRARLEVIEQERRSLHTAAGEAALNTEQQTRWEALDTEETDLRAQLAEAEATERRRDLVAASRAKWRSTQVAPTTETQVEITRGTPRQARVDTLIRALDGRIDDTPNQKHFEKIVKRHVKDADWAQNLLARSRPEYESGFAKLMMGRAELLDDDERRAVRAAIGVGTNTQGGYLVPTHLDPTLILTNTGTENALRPISRVVTITQGNTWHGVSTSGVSASFDAELAEVSDDTPGFVGPSVPTYMGRAFVQASFESFEDIDSLGTDVMMLFGDARDRLEGAKHCTGAGTTEPKGAFTAIGATAAHQTISTTAAAIGLVDLQAVYKAVGRRWRKKGKWIMNPLYQLAVQALGTALSASYTTNLAEDLTDRLIGKPVIDTDDAPTTQTTTALDQEILFGDFSNFLIVDKPGGMSVEFIPQLFNTANNLPDGRRGWIAHWRTGSDVLNTSAFQLLVDKTSA